MTSSGLELATLWLAAECLNQPRYRYAKQGTSTNMRETELTSFLFSLRSDVFLWNVGFSPNYAALQAGEQYSS
jgi:hypothetical protein